LNSHLLAFQVHSGKKSLNGLRWGGTLARFAIGTCPYSHLWLNSLTEKNFTSNWREPSRLLSIRASLLQAPRFISGGLLNARIHNERIGAIATWHSYSFLEWWIIALPTM
jgi:hypothetical protein